MRRASSIGSIILGVLMVIGGIATWLVVSDTLSDQEIVTSDDACLPGRTVAGPFTAYCEAKVIEQHSLEATGGLYYARDGSRGPVAGDRGNCLVPPGLTVHFGAGIRGRRNGRRHGFASSSSSASESVTWSNAP